MEDAAGEEEGEAATLATVPAAGASLDEGASENADEVADGSAEENDMDTDTKDKLNAMATDSSPQPSLLSLYLIYLLISCSI